MTALTSALAPQLTETLPPLDDQQHMVLDDVSWELYEKMLREQQERHVRITYDQGRMEIMSPLPEHEYPAHAIATFIVLLAMELDIPIGGLGSTTFRRKDQKKGLEPDECFYVQNEARVRGKKRLDLRRDPPPDLAIEIDITHRTIPKMPIYLKLGVAEVWRLDEAGLRCHLLRGGKYRVAEKGRAFPMLRVKDLEPFLRRLKRDDETTVMRAFRDWVGRSFGAPS
ncbi:MAG: Uma2 family endonuclease [Planctomycetota bacterium]|nr:Uma2 family endonuclease [Planctomycetota bacterium]